MGFSRQEYWRGLPCPAPGDLPILGIESRSLALKADSLLAELPGNPSFCYLQMPQAELLTPAFEAAKTLS